MEGKLTIERVDVKKRTARVESLGLLSSAPNETRPTVRGNEVNEETEEKLVTARVWTCMRIHEQLEKQVVKRKKDSESTWTR